MNIKKRKNFKKKLFEKFNLSIIEFKKKFNISKAIMNFVFFDQKKIHNWLFEYLKNNNKYIINYEYYLDLKIKNFNIDQYLRSTTLSQVRKAEKNFKVIL